MQQQQLIAKLKEKDADAFEKLYNMFSESMLGVIYNVIRDQEASEEILQDVFIKVWDKAGSYDASKGRFFTWILNISRNAAIDYTRSKKFNTQKRNLSSDLFVSTIENDENLDGKTDAIGIKKYVLQLKDKCIEIIDLIYFKGYTHSETAEKLEIPIGTVKTRNRSCISKLREVVLNT
ncbi:RNA polymerase sigma factor [Ascidiimonas sp. W6]|uniref:RNA polymerase sigma factor n=1 Tax=Ascidiimonas meishanensis TaxID=3128903 RepID=UPI0030EE47C6